VHVDEPRDEVGVARARARPELDLDRACDLEILRERLALVDSTSRRFGADSGRRVRAALRAGRPPDRPGS
jgi:hypothetical protein